MLLFKQRECMLLFKQRECKIKSLIVFSDFDESDVETIQF